MRNRRVALDSFDEDDPYLSASVRGTQPQPYFVFIDWSRTDRCVIASCDCPVGMRVVLCKHIFAVLLEADRHGAYEHLFPELDPLPIRPDPDMGELDETWLDVSEPEPFHARAKGPAGRALRKPAWLEAVNAVAAGSPALPQNEPGRTTKRRLEYHVDASSGALVVTLAWRNVLKSGGLGKCRDARLSPADVAALDAEDRRIFARARGCVELNGGRAPRYGHYGHRGYGYGGGAYGASRTEVQGFTVRVALAGDLLPALCATGRFGVVDEEEPGRGLHPLAWDPTSYGLKLILEPSDDTTDGVRVRGELNGGDQVLSAADVGAVTRDGILLFADRIAVLRSEHAAPDPTWLYELSGRRGALEVPAAEVDTFMQVTAEMGSLPDIVAAPGLAWSVVKTTPQLLVRFLETTSSARRIGAQIWFRYRAMSEGGELVRYRTPASAQCLSDEKQLVVRNVAFERAMFQTVRDLGIDTASYELQSSLRDRGGADASVDASQFPTVVRALMHAGYEVEAEGKPIREEVFPSIRVTSGIDWFEVDTRGASESAAVTLPELLRAVRERDPFVKLSDGSGGLLPEAWLDRYGPLVALGNTTEDGSALRYARSAGVFLDVMLAALPDIDFDSGFTRFRKELRKFSRLRPVRGPRSFKGTLRGYQELGLAWLKMLARFGLGGCLADDMGLGKTIQVLALLASVPKKKRGTNLIVAPRSLVFNWLDEAARFTPSLRAEAYWGSARADVAAQLDIYDLVVTTYGTLRRDIAELSKRRFSYVVLDEASAIKNPASQIAKACRLLTADNRLALTGTPVENRLTDLASILEFLNPGMLRSTNALQTLSSATADADQLRDLGRTLRPVLLRRTKEEVLSELPDKTEQVLHCELGRDQRKLYDELRDHYRALLDGTIRKRGLARSKIQVLEALLRLRQAACHPGLIDKTRRDESSAKLDALLATLMEVLEAGHKALVFSQFTSFLTLARDRVAERDVGFAYLDGKTRKRKAVVERFQNDPDCAVFFISLKAGGHGLNLTAAQYVFLLDPWWNPAAEAQAIDRAHRIGQTRPVFAYRMIAEDTVEERVLELQQHKRELAEGIFSGQRSLLGDLTSSDLEHLFS